MTKFVTVAGAFGATFTVTVIAGNDAPAATTAALVQVSVAKVQVQPEPAMAVAVKPAGSVSTKVDVPDVDMLPAFVTTTL